jgi:hypothetical protein
MVLELHPIIRKARESSRYVYFFIDHLSFVDKLKYIDTYVSDAEHVTIDKEQCIP